MTAVAYTTTVRGHVARVERVGRQHRVVLRHGAWEEEYRADADLASEAQGLLGEEIEASVLIEDGHRHHQLLLLRRFIEMDFLAAMLRVRDGLACTSCDAEKMLAELKDE